MHAGLSNAVSATFLALVVACLGRALARRPAILHCLWLLVLLKLVTPPLYNVPIPWPESLSARQGTVAAADPAQIEACYQLLQFDPEDLAVQLRRTELDTGAVTVNLEEATPEPDPAEPARATFAGAFQWLALHWVPIVGSLWLAGTLATALISARRIVRFQRLLREATPGSDQIQSWVDDLSASLGVERPPQVWWIAGKLSPMLWAVGACPRLIMPIELWKGLDERQRGTLLVHELAHLKRGDHRVRIFELVVTALYWWNPVLWWARQALRDVEEQCCDAWVVWAFPEAAKSYAETLLETLDFLNHSELSEPLLASGFGKVQHLRRRLTMIMSGTTPRLVGLRGTLAALSLGALLLPINASWAQTPEEKQEVRVIVKTDDGDDKVIKADGLEATNTFVIRDDAADPKPQTFTFYSVAPKVAGQADQVQILGDDGKPVTAMITLGESTIVSDDASGGKPDEKSRVSVVVKVDDSTVSISADSLDEAIKKIAEQIKALSAKAPQGEKEKAQQKALSQIVKQLDQVVSKKVAAGPSGAAGKGAVVSKNVFVVRGVEGFQPNNADPEKKAQIDGLRNEVKKLGQALAEAERKLAKLEGRTANVKVFSSLPAKGDSTVERRTVVRTPGNVDVKAAVNSLAKVQGLIVKPQEPIVLKVEPKVLRDALTVSSAVKTGKDGKANDDRIQALEKKLNQVIETLEKLKKPEGN